MKLLMKSRRPHSIFFLDESITNILQTLTAGEVIHHSNQKMNASHTFDESVLFDSSRVLLLMFGAKQRVRHRSILRCVFYMEPPTLRDGITVNISLSTSLEEYAIAFRALF